MSTNLSWMQVWGQGHMHQATLTFDDKIMCQMKKSDKDSRNLKTWQEIKRDVTKLN